MVKLKVSFDKSCGKINENEITASNETLGKTCSGKMGPFMTKSMLRNCTLTKKIVCYAFCQYRLQCGNIDVF
jgi:hypothetical protein